MKSAIGQIMEPEILNPIFFPNEIDSYKENKNYRKLTHVICSTIYLDIFLIVEQLEQ